MICFSDNLSGGEIMNITTETVNEFKNYLIQNDKSIYTVDKYIRDVLKFNAFVGEKDITRELTAEYKNFLISEGYCITSVNSMLSSINAFFDFSDRNDLKIKTVKMQRSVYCPEDKELTRAEYQRLCTAAKMKNNSRLELIIETVCSTGIRIGELKYITVDSIKRGEAVVTLKGKTRCVFIPNKLKNKLLRYASREKIKSGMIFITRTGNAVDRTNVWRDMKKLCRDANVNAEKVFPHNLRHLFARTFYNIDKDIAKLADVLGHSSIDTTRIYIISTGAEHRKLIDKMRLIL